MPDREFTTLLERQLSLAKAVNDSVTASTLQVDDEWSVYPEYVLHAHRTKGWEPSDPRPLVTWVDRVVTTRTEQFRRLARYMKAWRDAQSWSNGDPKSILLLMAIKMVFQQPRRDRDDLALLEVAQAIPAVLRGRIVNEADPVRGEDLAERLDKDGIRQELINGVNRLGGVLHRVLTGNLSDQEAYTALCAEWGHRFPAPPPEPMKRVSEVVRAAPAVIIPSRPPVGTRESG